MSFFVSEALKGRVTEENLIEELENTSIDEDSLIRVNAKFKNFSHDFSFVSYKKEKTEKTLIFEIPDSYQYVKDLLEASAQFEIVASTGIITTIMSKESNFELIRHYERNCYLLKIVISE